MHINIQAASRSLYYWCSQSADMACVPVFPMTAYNALLHPAQTEALSILPSRLARNAVDRAAFRAIAVRIVIEWQRCQSRINLHALSWAMSHMDQSQQQLLSTMFTENRMKDTPHSVPPDIMARLNEHLTALNSALLAKDPQMPNHLRESHRLLISYPETTHLLEDGEITTLIAAAVTYTNTEIVKAKLSPTKKAASKVTVDDL